MNLSQDAAKVLESATRVHARNLLRWKYRLVEVPDRSIDYFWPDELQEVMQMIEDYQAVRAKWIIELTEE